MEFVLTDEDVAEWKRRCRGDRPEGFPRNQRAEEERHEDWLYQRIRWLLDNLDRIEAAAGSVQPCGLTDRRQDFVRRYRDEPVPMWARLVRSKSAMAGRLFVLQQALGGRELTPKQYLELLPVLPASKPRVGAAAAEGPPTARSIRRAQAQIARAINEWGPEFERFEASHSDRTLAWGSEPRPRRELIFPEDVWRNGWHLALDKDELAWFMAGFIFSSSEHLANKHRDRLFGFGTHVNGIAVARHAREHLEHSAPRVLARHFIDAIHWLPSIPWHDDRGDQELPVFAFMGRDPDADDHASEAFIVITDHRVLVHYLRRACGKCGPEAWHDYNSRLFERFEPSKCARGGKAASVRWEGRAGAQDGYPNEAVHAVKVGSGRVEIGLVNKGGRFTFTGTDTRMLADQHERSGVPFSPLV